MCGTPSCLQLWNWIDLTLRSLRRQIAIHSSALPNPSSPAASLPVGLVDPSAVLILLAVAQVRGYDADGVYVGFAGQDPNCLWRGLTGFFVPWCPGCDQDGDRLLRDLESGLRKRGVGVGSVWDLPAEVHPQDGWFDGDRLMLGGCVDARPGISGYWQGVDMARDAGTVMLVATGPVATSLANLVLLDAYEHLEQLATLRPHASRWTTRQGDLGALAELAGIKATQAHPIRARRRLTQVPSAWGVYCDQDGSWQGPFANLRRAVTELTSYPVGGPHSILVEYLPADTPVRLADILQLGRTSP